MNKEEKIAKGRSILKMKVAMKYKQECNDPDLVKIVMDYLSTKKIDKFEIKTVDIQLVGKKQ